MQTGCNSNNYVIYPVALYQATSTTGHMTLSLHQKETQ